MKKNINKNYDGTPVTPEQVLVPILYDPLFAENCVNPDCVGIVTIAKKRFKVIFVAVDKEQEKAATSQFHFHVNELLGHYNHLPPFVKKKLAEKSPDKNPFVIRPDDESEYFPDANTELLAQEEKEELKERILTLFKCFLDKSPKHAYATLLMALGIKGKEFADSLQLGHDAANTVRKQVQSLAADNLQNIDQLDLDQIKPRANKNDKYYIEQAGKALDLLFDMYL